MALIRPSRPQLQHGYRSVGYQPNRPRTLHRPRPAPPVLTDLGPPDTTDLYPYQSEGAIWLRGRRSALLGDEMGCGKTPQLLRAIPNDGQAIVIAPASLRLNWQREADRWRPDLRTRFVTKDDPPTAWNPLPHELLIASYEALPPLEENAVALFPGQDLGQTTLVIDEAHYAKNYKALRSKRLRALAYQCGRVWGATGTPLLNSPQDLWGVLQTLRLHQDTYENWSTLCRIFGGEKNRWGGTIFDPAKGQPDEARERLAAVMLRRKRADVLPDLPAKRYETHYVDVQDHSLIEEMNEVCVAWARDAECEFDALEDLPPFELISSVRAKLAEAKIPAMVDFIGRYEEEKVPLLVFSSHNAPLYVAADREGWAAITGETDMKLRTTLVDCFQQGLLSGLAVSTKAGGVGITLTRASTALFVDRDFTPAVNLQAEDRMARIGQGANHVSIIAMVANHPLDERVNAILARKTALMNAVVG